jgi:uncharacterized protein YndB with AHSA1/START domain
MTAENHSNDATSRKPSQRDLVITRIFDAPRELLFKAWTEPDRLQQWWMPKGFSMLACPIELRPGGVFHQGMRSPDGRDMWGKWVFREVVVPLRLVFVVSFSDEKGGVTRHPFEPDWPLETLTTLTFSDHDGRTTFTMRWSPINASDAEQKAFGAAYESMQKGWTETLDKLGEHLAQG